MKRVFLTVLILAASWAFSYLVVDLWGVPGLLAGLPVNVLLGWPLARVWWPVVRGRLDAAHAKALAAKGRRRERLLWVGDGMTPPHRGMVGCPIDYHGRVGVVVDVSALTITVEWCE